MNNWDTQACEQFTETLWNQCCRFFKHKEDEGERKLFKIDGFRGPNLDATVLQHQAYAAYWMLRKGPLTGGGWLGDHSEFILILKPTPEAAFESNIKSRRSSFCTVVPPHPLHAKFLSFPRIFADIGCSGLGQDKDDSLARMCSNVGECSISGVRGR